MHIYNNHGRLVYANADIGPRYLTQTIADRSWLNSEFVRGDNIIGVRYVGAADVRLPHTLEVEKIVTVKDEAGLGMVTVSIY